jgi:hypothetical protein
MPRPPRIALSPTPEEYAEIVRAADGLPLSTWVLREALRAARRPMMVVYSSEDLGQGARGPYGLVDSGADAGPVEVLDFTGIRVRSRVPTDGRGGQDG